MGGRDRQERRTHSVTWHFEISYTGCAARLLLAVARSVRNESRFWSKPLIKPRESVWSRRWHGVRFRVLRLLDIIGGLAVRTWLGANLIATVLPGARPLLCADCFIDHGLKLDAARIGIANALPCPNCGAKKSKKLTPHLIHVLASQFFVRGSVQRAAYGAAPTVQYNKHQFRRGDYDGPPWMKRDLGAITESVHVGFFQYGPRLWMLGEVYPLKDLQDEQKRDKVIQRIIAEYPHRIWSTNDTFYRLRLNPANPSEAGEYDSAPEQLLERGRLDSALFPVMYCSKDIEGCAHECRVTVEDDLYVATLRPKRELKLLDLTELLTEDGVDEFESLDMAVHMLFYAGPHSYALSRAIAVAAKAAGFDGLLYPSYFGQVRSGRMPFETVYGLSVRRFPGAAERERHGIYPNLAIFGRPLRDGYVEVACVNRLVLHLVRYDVRFGPVGQAARWE